jgi:DNA-binding NarL/FixJ family response regulator
MPAHHAKGSIRVVIADDDTNLRSDLRRLLELESDIEVVALAHDGQHAIDQCGSHDPDVVVMDVRMPVMDGIAATQILRDPNSSEKKPAVLVLTTFDLDEYVLAAVRAGAAGFLLKDQAPENLADAVRTVAKGEAMLAPRATALLMQAYARPQPVASKLVSTLTKREREVTAYIAQGLSNEEIAEALVVSVATVKTHVSNLLMKLGIENRIQVVVWAYESGIVLAGGSTSL